MSTQAYWIQSKKIEVLDLSISTNPPGCSYTICIILPATVYFASLSVKSLFPTCSMSALICILAPVVQDLCTGSLLDTHHHRACFQETEQTTPVTLTPQVTSLEWELSHFSLPRKTRPLSVCYSCSMVGIPQSRVSRLSFLHLHNIAGGFCIKVNCFFTVELIVSLFFNFWNFNSTWKIPTFQNREYLNLSHKTSFWMCFSTHFWVTRNVCG